MSDSQKSKIIDDAKGLSRWFAIDLVIKIFGVVIWEYHFPPKENEHV